MSDNMSDMMQKLSGMLNGKEIPDNIKDMLGSVVNGNSSAFESHAGKQEQSDENHSSNTSEQDFSNIDIDTILKMQKIIKSLNTQQANSNVNLLRSLKPYLKPSRQDKVEQYIQLFNMEKVIEMMNHNGGDKK